MKIRYFSNLNSKESFFPKFPNNCTNLIAYKILQNYFKLILNNQNEINLTSKYLILNINKLNYKLNNFNININKKLTLKQLNKLSYNSFRRFQYEPLQYILGNWDFYGRTFLCKQPILIPRVETEYLIELILNSQILNNIQNDNDNNNNNNYPKILDIGCGSGIIGITLLAELKNKGKCTGIDIDENAIKLTLNNCKLVLCNSCHSSPSSSSSISKTTTIESEVQSESEVEKKDININEFKCCKYNGCHQSIQEYCKQNKTDKYDLIVSNPPYIPTSSLYSKTNPLQKEVLEYESHIALDGGKNNGLDIIRDILLNTSTLLSPSGTKELWMEVHESHPELILSSYTKYLNSKNNDIDNNNSNSSNRSNNDSSDSDFLSECWNYYDVVETIHDLFKNPRFVRFRSK